MEETDGICEFNISEIGESNSNSLFFYGIILFIIISILIVGYNYFFTKQKHVTFQDKLNECYGDSNTCPVV
jgi:ABC-type phosphate transport system permease subunit